MDGSVDLFPKLYYSKTTTYMERRTLGCSKLDFEKLEFDLCDED